MDLSAIRWFLFRMEYNRPMDIPVHTKPKPVDDQDFSRLEKLWANYKRDRSCTTFTTLEQLLEDHPSYQDGFPEAEEEFRKNHYEKFFVQLSWSDLPYRWNTKQLLQKHAPIHANPLVTEFMKQFEEIDTDQEAAFIFPESFASQYFVTQEVCRNAKRVVPVKNLFPDQDDNLFLAVFHKSRMEEILLLHHLIWTSNAHEVFGGYKIYGSTLPYYLDHLIEQDQVLRSPWLPDRLSRYEGALAFHHNPSKIVRVRRQIDHILEKGWFQDELELFHALAIDIMSVFQWWYEDIDLYERKDHLKTDWRMKRMQIRSQLTADGILHPKWKHELSLFLAARKLYPDAIYQYRPEWLDLQSIDIYLPSIQTGIEYNGIQHYQAIDFFGGEEALEKRKELDQKKAEACAQNHVHLIAWSYETDPTEANLKAVLRKEGKA